MTSTVNPEPGSRRCPNCLSYKVVEKEDSGSNPTFIILKLHCNMCRTDVIFWSGTRAELKKFKRNRKRFKARLKRVTKS